MSTRSVQLNSHTGLVLSQIIKSMKASLLRSTSEAEKLSNKRATAVGASPAPKKRAEAGAKALSHSAPTPVTDLVQPEMDADASGMPCKCVPQLLVSR